MNKGISSQLFPLTVSNSKNYFILFILWPFLAFLLALKNYSQKEARNVVYIFLVYYGFTFVNSNEAVDAFRYALHLKAISLLPFSDFFKIVGGIYATDTSIDIVEPLISFIVSRITNHYSVYFAAWAAIFGFFYLKSINLLYDRYHENPGLNAWIVMTFFIMILPITAISAVRMWTAAWVFFYGAYHVVLYRNPKYLLLTMVASLIHWSFLSANAILLVYFLAGNRNVIYFPMLIASFALPQIITPVFRSISFKLGGAIQNRYESYASEDYILARQESLEQGTWFLKIGNDLVFYFLLLAMVIIQIKSVNSAKEKYEKNLYSFLLLFLSFVNFGKVIPSFGGRFQILFFMFATLYVFQYFIRFSGNKINLLTSIGLFPMLLYTAIIFRLASESISAWIFTPGLGLPWLDPALSVADLLFY